MTKSSPSSPIESYLTRHLDIRFIDARNIVIEAKISLGIRGYHHKDQEGLLRAMAIQLFQQHSPESKHQMMNLRCSLDHHVRYPSSISLPSSSCHHKSSSSTQDSTTTNNGQESSSSCGADMLIASSDISFCNMGRRTTRWLY